MPAVDPSTPIPDLPIAAAAAARHLVVADGLEATLALGEPDLVNPKAIAFDERGRLWVIQDVTYNDGPGQPPQPATVPSQVLVFTDTNGDGRFDRKDVFLDLPQMPSGSLAVGQGWVVIGIGAHLMRFPIAPGGTRPSGDGQVLVTGWVAGRHEHNNGLEWGPDGWLYGGQGFVARSSCWLPTTPITWHPGDPVPPVPGHPSTAVPGSCGVFRLKIDGSGFEWWAEGGSNIWGMDFDVHGDLQSVATVSNGPFHWIQGGRYDRQDGPARGHNPFTYRYQTSNLWELRLSRERREALSQAVRSGTAPTEESPPGWRPFTAIRQMGGAYLFGDGWPVSWRGRFAYTVKHGIQLINVAAEGCGTIAYAAAGDRLVTAPPLKAEASLPPPVANGGYQIFKVVQGPDQALYALDWAENGECHTARFKRDGRIYRIAPKGLPACGHFDLAAEDDDRLARRTMDDWEWFSRRARVELAGRATRSALAASTIPALHARFTAATTTAARLRALWALHACRATTASFLAGQFKHPDERVRAWSIQLACERNPVERSLVDALALLARDDASPIVRRHLASAAQRLPAIDARPILLALIAHAEDDKDRNLPLLYWYALEPHIGADPAFAASALAVVKLGAVRECIVRRMAVPTKPLPKK